MARTRLLVAGVVALAGIGVASWIWPWGGESRPESIASLGEIADPNETYDPVDAGEDLPDGYRQVLRRDGIAPIYDPQFVTADESDWPDTALIIGVEIQGEAKAYPVSHLNSREMVIDSLAGIPILVTW